LRLALVPTLIAMMISACAAGAPGAPPSPAAAGTRAASEATTEAQGAAWEQEWQALLAAARQEGTVAVLGPPTPELRLRLPEAFRQRFGIAMEYTGQASGDFAPRLLSERSAGIYSADVVISGSGSMYDVLAGRGQIENGVMGVLAPLRPALILPEVLDTAKYRLGTLIFMDPAGQYIYRMNNTVNRTITLNTEFVRPSDIQSWYDLLKPEYHGRIVTYDPLGTGSAINQSSELYLNIGPEYVRRLYVDQQPFVTRDHRQTADLLARGTHPIALSLQQQEVGRLAREGFAVRAIRNPPEAPESLSAGFGHLGIVDRAPHPNAAKVFVNWLLTREGQQLWQDAQLQVSVRNDLDDAAVPHDWLPQPGVDYVDENSWEFTLNVQPRIRDDLRVILGRR
jgi:iron(III) transport system substrate-binding protein